MATMLFYALFLCIYTIKAQSDCSRHRKEWSTLTDTEQLLYINGFKKLADNGFTQTWATYHNDNFDVLHNGPVFLPWHRQFIYNFETAIRDLGGDYECFTLPYWDWSREPTQSDVISNPENQPELLNEGNGMGGDPNGGCVSNGVFTASQYDPAWQTCLRRDIDYLTDEACEFIQASGVMQEIDVTNEYGEFRPSFELIPHGRPHNCIGRGGFFNNRVYHMASGYSPDDPWFYLHHAFVDYVYALWQDCHNYDGVPISSVTPTMYNGDLFAELPGFSGITAASVLDISVMGVSYEKGPFWENADVDGEDNCGVVSDPINPEWFKDTTTTILRSGGSVDSDSHAMSRQILSELKESNERYNRTELVQLWSLKVCRYEQRKKGNICTMPDYFEDCSNMAINPETKDIDITLRELLQKKGITICMRRTRRRYYEWAKLTRTLKKLCDGCYDRFCDKSVLRDKCINNDARENMAVHINPNHAVLPPDEYNNRGPFDIFEIINEYNYILYIFICVLIGSLGINMVICCDCIRNKHKPHVYVEMIKNIDSEYDDDDVDDV